MVPFDSLGSGLEHLKLGLTRHGGHGHVPVRPEGLHRNDQCGCERLGLLMALDYVVYQLGIGLRSGVVSA